MRRFDLVIANGTIIDGQRTARFVGDIGVKNGKIAAITGQGGLSKHPADRTIDASGRIVAPGFIDLHTHYDAQIFWDPYCTISGWHGVTCAVIGNCGFGLAPCRPEMWDRAMQTLTRNEAISYPAMKEGIPWGWETLPEYFGVLEDIPKGINLLSYVPLAPIFMEVMGVEAAKTRRPTSEEMARMKDLVLEGIDAGACGISAQYLGEISPQRDYDGTPMVTDLMHFDDFCELASVLKERGGGAIQCNGITPEQGDALCEASGGTLIYNVIALECDQHGQKTGDWRKWVEHVKESNQRGNRWAPQFMAMALDQMFTFEDFNMFDSSPQWRDVTLGTIVERKKKMQDPVLRQALKEDYDAMVDDDEKLTLLYLQKALAAFSVVRCEEEALKKYEGRLLGQIASAEGKHVIDVMLDIAVADDLLTTFASPPNDLNTEDMRALLNAPYGIPSLSDGGAHQKFVWMGRFCTEYLVNWVREKKLVDLEYAHWHLSCVPAQATGLLDRGVLRIGAAADILVYDLENLGWTEIEKTYDLPAGDWRITTRGVGYDYTIVNGVVTFEGMTCTSATPGEFLRNGHSANTSLGGLFRQAAA